MFGSNLRFDGCRSLPQLKEFHSKIQLVHSRFSYGKDLRILVFCNLFLAFQQTLLIKLFLCLSRLVPLFLFRAVYGFIRVLIPTTFITVMAKYEKFKVDRLEIHNLRF